MRHSSYASLPPPSMPLFPSCLATSDPTSTLVSEGIKLPLYAKMMYLPDALLLLLILLGNLNTLLTAAKVAETRTRTQLKLIEKLLFFCGLYLALRRVSF